MCIYLLWPKNEYKLLKTKIELSWYILQKWFLIIKILILFLIDNLHSIEVISRLIRTHWYHIWCYMTNRVFRHTFLRLIYLLKFIHLWNFITMVTSYTVTMVVEPTQIKTLRSLKSKYLLFFLLWCTLKNIRFCFLLNQTEADWVIFKYN